MGPSSQGAPDPVSGDPQEAASCPQGVWRGPPAAMSKRPLGVPDLRAEFPGSGSGRASVPRWHLASTRDS